MNQLLKVIGTSLVLSTLVIPVFAEGRLGLRQEVREATRPGLFGKLFNKKGRAAIGRATLTAKNGTTLTVTSEDGKTYTVNTDSNTQFRRRFWGKSSFDEMNTGDIIAIIGQWTDDAHTTIQAKLVRDTSIQKRFGVFFGTVTSVTSTGWVMNTINRGSQTVTVVSSTKIVNRKGDTLTQTQVLVGHKIRVRGLWDNKANTVTEVKEVKDFTL